MKKIMTIPTSFNEGVLFANIDWVNPIVRDMSDSFLFSKDFQPVELFLVEIGGVPFGREDHYLELKGFCKASLPYLFPFVRDRFDEGFFKNKVILTNQRLPNSSFVCFSFLEKEKIITSYDPPISVWSEGVYFLCHRRG